MLHEVAGPKHLLATMSQPDRVGDQYSSRRAAEKAQPGEPHNSRQQVVSEHELSEAVQQVQQEFQHVAPHLQFEVDRELDRVIVRILNAQSGEVIRQIPPQEVIKLARSLRQTTGVLLTQQA